MDAVTRQDLIIASKRIVVKIGSTLLVEPGGGLREEWLSALASDVARLKKRGQDVVIVSSGSIALGRHVFSLDGMTLSLEQSQAAAAVGQIKLARAYERALAAHDVTAAQVLVTLEDSENRRRYLNSRATLETLLTMGVCRLSTRTTLSPPMRSGLATTTGSQRRWRPCRVRICSVC